MTAKDALTNQLISTQQMLGMFLADLSDADLQMRPVPDANNIAWQLGHLIASEGAIGAMIDFKYPELPPIVKLLGTGASSQTHPDGGNLSKAQYMSLFNAAREATRKSPGFGAALVRVAELEFGFGRTAEALEALNKGLQLSPRQAEGLALKGFLLAAQNKSSDSLAAFDQAIAADGALGNAWLGRGLAKIRMGRGEEGRADLQVAATLEDHEQRKTHGRTVVDIANS